MGNTGPLFVNAAQGEDKILGVYDKNRGKSWLIFQVRRSTYTGQRQQIAENTDDFMEVFLFFKNEEMHDRIFQHRAFVVETIVQLLRQGFHW